MTRNLRMSRALFHTGDVRTRRSAPVRAAHRLTDSGSDPTRPRIQPDPDSTRKHRCDG